MDDKESSKNNTTFKELYDGSLKRYITVYLDIVGYKNYIKNYGEEKAFEAMSKAHSAIENFKDSLLDDALKRDVALKVDFKIYTDNILIYTELKDDGGDGFRTTMSVAFAAYVQNVIFKFLDLLRGAIVQGDCYIGDFLIGAPLLDAYEMESKKAVWPRVLISKDVIGMIDSFKETLVKDDGDGLFFLNYLQFYIAFNPEKSSPDKILMAHGKQIQKVSSRSYRVVESHPVKNVGDLLEILKINRMYNLLTIYHNDLCDIYGVDDAKIKVKESSQILEQHEEIMSMIIESRSSEDVKNLQKLLPNIGKTCGILVEVIDEYNSIWSNSDA